MVRRASETAYGVVRRFYMDRDAEYRAKAEEARREADRSSSEVERSAWLRIEEGFLGLLRKRPQSDDDPKAK
jgi:hypothetical protein